MANVDDTQDPEAEITANLLRNGRVVFHKKGGGNFPVSREQLSEMHSIIDMILEDQPEGPAEITREDAISYLYE